MENLVGIAVTALVRTLSLLTVLLGIVLTDEVLQGSASLSDTMAGAVSVGGLTLVIAFGLWRLAPNLVKA